MVTQSNSLGRTLKRELEKNLLVVGLCLSLASVCSCSKSATAEVQKLSPNELIAQLGTSGVKVEKNGSFTNESPVEMNIKLMLDGQEDQDFAAKRFPSLKMASDYCETQKACFTIKHWSIEALFPDAHRNQSWKRLSDSFSHAPTSGTLAP